MTIHYRDDFDMTSARKGVCYVLNRPKRDDENGVFRLGSIDFEGNLDISEQVIKDAAGVLGWWPPDKVEQLMNVHDTAMSEAMAEIEILNTELDKAPAYTTVVADLARERDLAEAAKQDAIRQFQVTEGDFQVAERELGEAMEANEALQREIERLQDDLAEAKALLTEEEES